MRRLNLNSFKNIEKAYTEGIYADTPANRKLGRVGMTYTAYNEKLKEEEDALKEKKSYVADYEGESIYLSHKPVSKEKIVELATNFVKERIENNDIESFSLNIEEDTENWSEEDIENKPFDVLSIKAIKHGSNIEISVYDFRENKFLRNDTLKREDKNLAQRTKYIEKKYKENTENKSNWMQELSDYKKDKEMKEDYINSQAKAKKRMQNVLQEAFGFKVDLTIRSQNKWTVSYEGLDSKKENKIKNYFNTNKYSADVRIDYDEELDETFVYIDLIEK